MSKLLVLGFALQELEVKTLGGLLLPRAEVALGEGRGEGEERLLVPRRAVGPHSHLEHLLVVGGCLQQILKRLLSTLVVSLVEEFLGRWQEHLSRLGHLARGEQRSAHQVANFEIGRIGGEDLLRYFYRLLRVAQNQVGAHRQGLQRYRVRRSLKAGVEEFSSHRRAAGIEKNCADRDQKFTLRRFLLERVPVEPLCLVQLLRIEQHPAEPIVDLERRLRIAPLQQEVGQTNGRCVIVGFQIDQFLQVADRLFRLVMLHVPVRQDLVLPLGLDRQPLLDV